MTILLCLESNSPLRYLRRRLGDGSNQISRSLPLSFLYFSLILCLSLSLFLSLSISISLPLPFSNHTHVSVWGPWTGSRPAWKKKSCSPPPPLIIRLCLDRLAYCCPLCRKDFSMGVSPGGLQRGVPGGGCDSQLRSVVLCLIPNYVTLLWDTHGNHEKIHQFNMCTLIIKRYFSSGDCRSWVPFTVFYFICLKMSKEKKNKKLV